MDIRENNLKYLIDNHKDIYGAYTQYGRAIHESGGPLDDKTRWLIKISTSATQSCLFALKTHIEKAVRSGCTREEIEHAILLIAPTAGFPRMMEALLVLREELGED